MLFIIIYIYIFSTLRSYPIDDEELMEEELAKGIQPPTFPEPTELSLGDVPFAEFGDILMVPLSAERNKKRKN